MRGELENRPMTWARATKDAPLLHATEPLDDRIQRGDQPELYQDALQLPNLVRVVALLFCLPTRAPCSFHELLG
jgi:hypothetical protein